MFQHDTLIFSTTLVARKTLIWRAVQETKAPRSRVNKFSPLDRDTVILSKHPNPEGFLNLSNQRHAWSRRIISFKGKRTCQGHSKDEDYQLIITACSNDDGPTVGTKIKRWTDDEKERFDGFNAILDVLKIQSEAAFPLQRSVRKSQRGNLLVLLWEYVAICRPGYGENGLTNLMIA